MKKAYIIPLVILLLFISVVPCFSISSDDLVLTLDIIGIEDYYCDFDGTNKNYIVLNTPLVFGHYYYISCTTDPFATVQGSSEYFSFQLYYNPASFQSGPRYDLSYNDRSANGFIAKAVVDYVQFRCISYHGFDTDVYVNIRLIDLTEIYGSNIPSLEDFNNILSIFNVPYLDSGTYTFTNSTLDFNPFLNFYSGIFQSFNYFGSLGSTYSYVFAFFVGTLSILLVIFLVVFMIKRFTGGKC